MRNTAKRCSENSELCRDEREQTAGVGKRFFDGYRRFFAPSKKWGYISNENVRFCGTIIHQPKIYTESPSHLRCKSPLTRGPFCKKTGGKFRPVLSVIIQINVVYKVDKFLNSSSGEGACDNNMPCSCVMEEKLRLLGGNVVAVRLGNNSDDRLRKAH